MNDQPNTETAPQLVSRYNALVAQAGGVGLTGYRELRVFHDKPTALARIAQLESVIRAHESGEKAEAARDNSDAYAEMAKTTGLSREEIRTAVLAKSYGEELQSSSNEHTDPITDEQQENEVAKKVKAKKSAKIAKPAKAPRRVAAAKSSANGEKHSGPRAGSKTEVVRGLLTRKGGCTSREVLDATGWPAVSMPAMAKACGLELRKDKEKGSATQYFGS